MEDLHRFFRTPGFEDEAWEIIDTLVCADCVTDEDLKKRVRESETTGTCGFCRQESTLCWNLPTLAKAVADVLQRGYGMTPLSPYDEMQAQDEPFMMSKEYSANWERRGTPLDDLLQYLVTDSTDLCSSLLECLDRAYSPADSDYTGEELEFAPDTHYEPCKPNGQSELLDHAWRQFESEIKHRVRFFSAAHKALLDHVFSVLSSDKLKAEIPFILELPVNSSEFRLYRGREFESYQKAKVAIDNPATELGPPPIDRCNQENRLSARGLSCFYGAQDIDTVLAELRPPVGSTVVVGQFDWLRPLRLLNLGAATDAVPDCGIFDEEYTGLVDALEFMKGLSKRIARPIHPDHAPYDYLPTQAVADYLANHETLEIDGILYESSQTDKSGFLNVALFYKASGVSGSKHETQHTGYRTPCLAVNRDSLKYLDIVSVAIGYKKEPRRWR